MLIVGGGINGVGIARDAAGRGLRVILCEQGDLGCATSSASSKLIHGGLRYLEHLELRLVAQSLAEREVLLRAAPHLVRPMRFVMPHVPGLRPAWMIRSGLLLYDWLARRQTLAGSARVDLRQPPYRGDLKPDYVRGYVYSDCKVDDARLVIANAQAAAETGAKILPRTTCVAAVREAARWRATLRRAEGVAEVAARVLVNAAGPWVEPFLTQALGAASGTRVKLVQGSHIVVPQLYEGDHAYILQNDDRRVVFVYPYEGVFTLVGTTDVEFAGNPRDCRATPEEVAYLCKAANRYFARPIAPGDVRWAYCGVRALVDDGTVNPSKVTRDYLLRLDESPEGAPVLSVFGGKITTYRRLAERALEKLAPSFPGLPGPWTGNEPLPGGALPGGDVERHVLTLAAARPALPSDLVRAIVNRHGSRAERVLGPADQVEDLGEFFGPELCAREVDYFLAHEWAREADDVLWRRTRTGLHLSGEAQGRLVRYVAARAPACMR